MFINRRYHGDYVSIMIWFFGTYIFPCLRRLKDFFSLYFFTASHDEQLKGTKIMFNLVNLPLVF